ncbi:hypothetical protein D3C72_2333160 [compost metagenome]
MGVDVDKAGAEDLAFGIDLYPGLQPGQIAKRLDSPLMQRDIAAKRRRPGAVDQGGVADQGVNRVHAWTPAGQVQLP